MMHEPASLLIVDDSEENRVLLTMQLQKNGYVVTEAEDGLEALDLIETNSFDLILLDLVMPNINGLECLTRIRKNHSPLHLPVIMVTAKSDANIVVEALDLGANDYVTMPTDLQVLLARVALHLRAKQAEAALLESQRILERRVAERTTELQKKNLRLKQLYQTAHQFVDNVSHEFRTPLTVIKEFSSILADGLGGEVNEDQLEYLNIILNRADDLALMVDDMLDISKLEADMLSVHRKQCCVVDIIDRVRPALERKAVTSGVTLNISIDDETPSVYCDTENISRAIINLAINACKFSKDNGQVTLKVGPDPELPVVRFSIIDNGRGIAPENVTQIFERFKQVGSDTKVNNKGFGLGLNIAKELVQINFGDISVESEIGKGSTFSFTIPSFDPVFILERFGRRIRDFRNDSSFLSLLTLRITPETDEETSNEVETFLHQKARRSDVIFRMSQHSWIVCAAGSEQHTEDMAQRLQSSRIDSNRNRPAGPLPEFAFAIHGAWKTEGQFDEFMAAFKSEWSVAEIKRSLPAVQQTSLEGAEGHEARTA